MRPVILSLCLLFIFASPAYAKGVMCGPLEREETSAVMELAKKVKSHYRVASDIKKTCAEFEDLVDWEALVGDPLFNDQLYMAHRGQVVRDLRFIMKEMLQPLKKMDLWLHKEVKTKEQKLKRHENLAFARKKLKKSERILWAARREIKALRDTDVEGGHFHTH